MFNRTTNEWDHVPVTGAGMKDNRQAIKNRVKEIFFQKSYIFKSQKKRELEQFI